MDNNARKIKYSMDSPGGKISLLGIIIFSVLGTNCVLENIADNNQKEPTIYLQEKQTCAFTPYSASIDTLVY
jgi:hypothetical protein